ncbi:MAG: type II toxin-antitoxin system prevent-host-death family antitoxin [Solirubrobacteraceae bacterium]|nr:type II toxin-antitoxin system prevent-host-death family antitoxin [Solirubrobacteraceae bacterium]
MARSVGIRELKGDASGVIRAVEAGEDVTVTRRGRVVARVVPAGDPIGGADGAVRAALAERGLRWSGRRPRLPEPIALSGPGPTASESVLDDRGPR